MSTRSKILLFSDWYEPGFKAGGPIRSAVNFVQNMKGDFDIYVFTRDRDLHSDTPFNNIEADEWITGNGGTKIFYASPVKLNRNTIRALIRELAPDFVYLNSMYSVYFTIYPLLFTSKSKGPVVVLSPRGMLKDSALQFKSAKKKIFIQAFKWMGLHSRIRFHATDTTEEKDIFSHFGRKVAVETIANFPAILGERPPVMPKRSGEVKLLFTGRIHPIKNLDYLLEALGQVKGILTLSIVGDEEDQDFATQCRALASQLDQEKKVIFLGQVPNEELPAVIAQHHVFALPTRGENYGHAIFEALKGGLPVLISDQTPWRDLTPAMAGWDIPLANKKKWSEAIQRTVDLNQDEYRQWSDGAWQFVNSYVQKTDLKAAYNKLFS
ncbi:glycosyltransferase family 4 protein [Pseudoflavitalea rhizosphaerae]|uniref:glycosyltransferase family 4 protein n=1 Tax=Pseudoflavitalea rhizosphaerae TaxID=1884793 RepID=UPI000F8E46FB|nr:glycosyltransferase family 4 protein [Pseudoflavitalea rhizosphaerae]